MSERLEELTTKQQRFVEEYCVDFNATQAAVRAGYSEKTAGVIGWENLRKPEIEKAIKARLERLSMTAEEALKRLTDMARGTLHPFIETDGDGRVWFDLSHKDAQQHLHLIKKVKHKRSRRDGDSEWEDDWMEVELHDAKDALDKILKAHGGYTSRLDITSGGEAIEGFKVILPDADE